MTTTVKMFVDCRVCGKASPQFGIGSTNAYGFADLDSRPPEMQRSTIGDWLLKADRTAHTTEAALGAAT